MFYEYALIPDIFNLSNYSSPDIFRHCLSPLKEVLLDYAVVRDMNNGDWSEYVNNNLTRWHPIAKELLNKINSQNRLRRINDFSGNHPADDFTWASKAVDSHQIENLDGIIISHQNAASFSENPLFSDVERLPNSTFWRQRSSSRRINKNMQDYLLCMHLILLCSNSLIFIDPHIDPSKNQYSHFADIFNYIASRPYKPVIEVHRVGWYSKDRHGGPIWEDNAAWESTFRRRWESLLQSINVQVKVFIWNDFHDRYLISDLAGISVPYGFDTSNQNITTTWSRLSRADRDDVQREFDPASGMHTLRHRFTIN